MFDFYIFLGILVLLILVFRSSLDMREKILVLILLTSILLWIEMPVWFADFLKLLGLGAYV